MPRDPRPDAAVARTPSGGFTLIELLVVLAIMGLVIGLTVPLLGRGQARATLTGATAEIRAALGDARIAAIAKDRAVIFRGDGAGGYWIDGSHRRLAAASGALAGLRIATAGGSQIAFFASGGSSGGRVVLSGAGGRGEIRVDAITGRAALAP